MKSIFAMMAAAVALGQSTAKLEYEFRANRKRGKKGGGRGGFRPPRHARARLWKKAFGGLCVPRIDATQFMFE